MFAPFRRFFSRRRHMSSSRLRRRPAFRVEELEPRTLLSGTGIAGLQALPLDNFGPSVHRMHPTLVLNPIRPADAPAGLGYTPDQFRTAYGINNISLLGGSITGDGSGQTIAIVVAYNDPNIAGDLDGFDANVYLSANDKSAGQTLFNRYGPAAGFFSVFDEHGNGLNPSTETSVPDSGTSHWSVEESIDVEWAHAIAPGARIDVVECNSSFSNDMYPGVVTAAGLPGVSAVSMSWGAAEYAGEIAFDRDFVHAGVTFLAATGDYGAPGLYPAYSPNVVAVGGTSLYVNADNTWQNETGWSGSGGGTSLYEWEPSYQGGFQYTTQRTTPDVAMDADPNTGVVTYDSYDFGSNTPWVGIGGTSVATPSWAGLIAISNQGRVAQGIPLLNAASPVQTQYITYAGLHFDVHDIVTDDNANGNGGFHSGPSYDQVTGLGSPMADTFVPDLASYDPPTVTYLTPNSGPLSGGTQLAIFGTGFTPTAEVEFGGYPVPAGDVSVVTSNEILVTTEPISAGEPTTVDVQVITATGISPISVNDQFTYVDSSSSSLTLSPSSPSGATALADATANQSYSLTISATGGSGSYAFSVASGSLPQGMSLTGGGLLSGTPTAQVGYYTFTVLAIDNNQAGLSGSQSYTMVVHPASTLTLGPGALPNATAKTGYGPITLSATGGFGTYTFAVAAGSQLPAGLTLSSSGVLSGTPTTAGTFTFTLVATDSTQPFLTGRHQYTLTVTKALAITPLTLPVATVGDAFSKKLIATGGSGKGYTFALASGSSLPAGLTLTSAGLLSGKPAAAGKYTFAIVVTDSNGGMASKTYTLTIDPALTISPAGLPPATIGLVYSEQFTASGGSGKSYVFKAAGLPTWLKISSAGVLTGTPPSNAPASITFTVTVTDSEKGTVSEQLTLAIDP
jgi:hypothetical protein